MDPFVSVIMAVYNQEDYVKHAIESILSQTYGSFEFLIVDDGSTDDTTTICNKYAQEVSSRIRIFRNERNLGLTRSLNIGLISARGKYIARMDADDVSLPERLETQVTYLESHPEIGLVGSFYSEIDGIGNIINTIVEFPVTPIIINWRLCFENPIAHPPIMVRKELLDRVDGYDEKYAVSQDYDLFIRLARITRLANISEVLFYWRVHTNNVSKSRNKEQREAAYEISRKNATQLLGRDVSEKEIQLIWNRSHEDRSSVLEMTGLLIEFYRKVTTQNMWLPVERKLLRKYVSIKMFYYIRPYLKCVRSMSRLFDVFSIDPYLIFRLFTKRYQIGSLKRRL